MKNTAILFHLSLLLLAFSLLGCRRTDVREVTIEIPGLTSANQPTVISALSRYEGVDKSSYVWDMANKRLTLKYDSMKVAQSNLRYSIEESGVKVTYPEKKDDHAGY